MCASAVSRLIDSARAAIDRAFAFDWLVRLFRPPIGYHLVGMLEVVERFPSPFVLAVAQPFDKKLCRAPGIDALPIDSFNLEFLVFVVDWHWPEVRVTLVSLQMGD